MDHSGLSTKRADAVMNRARILDVAQSVFAERGLDLEVSEIASRAHLGVGTLYRHFSNREDLLRAIVIRTVDDAVAQLRSAIAAADDPRAALQALVLIGLEKRLHRGLPEPRADSMPPLLTLERFLFRIVGAGFILLTLTLATGILFSEELFGKPVRFTHKVVFSVLGWIVFAALIFGRHRYGWRGKSALSWVLAGTGLVFLAYVGSKFVLEVLLGR